MPASDPITESSVLAERLKAPQAELPFISAACEGIGGELKSVPEHFEVEEVLPYEPCGEGEHLFVRLRRSGWNTADVGRALADALGLIPGDIGWGGRKDKQALTTQTFSLPLALNRSIAEVERALSGLPFELLDLRRHRNKLKTGHVAANRFRIVLSRVAPDSLERAQAIAAILRERGLPNFFGEQRFGHHFNNLSRAAELALRTRPGRGSQVTFIVSALQGALFNIWLKARIDRDDYGRMLSGDIAQKTDTGGLFRVDQVEEADQRLRDKAIVFTGPQFGHKMMAAQGTAGEQETAVLQSMNLTPDVFKRLRAPGTRRAGLLHLSDMAIQAVDEGLQFNFSLPSGSYATTVLREFRKGPGTGSGR